MDCFVLLRFFGPFGLHNIDLTMFRERSEDQLARVEAETAAVGGRNFRVGSTVERWVGRCGGPVPFG